MKHKHYYLLLLVVATLLVSCPVNQSSPTPSKPDIVVPQEPSAPTNDVEGNVEEPEITAWKDALRVLVHYSANGNINNISQETTALMEVLAETPVEIEDTPNNIRVTYYKGSYVSEKFNNKESNKSTGIMDVSGKYNDSGTSFKVYVNGTSEYGEAGSSTFTGTATYTEGSTTSQLDVNKAFGGEQIEDNNSPEYKARLIINNMPFTEGLNKTETIFTNYKYLPDGYTFNGKTVGVEKTANNIFVSDQEKTDGTVSVTIPNAVEGEVNLIVRYDIKRTGKKEGEIVTKEITTTSYMHVKKEGDAKFKIFPTSALSL